MAIKENKTEKGVALASTIIIMALLGVVTLTVLAVVSTESRTAGADLQRTQTFYATQAGIEQMTTDFCALFGRTARPTTAQLNTIAADYPTDLVAEGFTFQQTLAVDNVTLAAMGANTSVTIPSGPFAGLVASVTPFLMTSTATQGTTGTQVALQRKINNYLIPIFQFGMFSNEDIELHPGPAFYFNGRVHANGNVYVNGNVTFLAKVTTANEVVYDVLRNGNAYAGSSVSMTVGATNVALNHGSVVLGPNVTGATAGSRGYNPGAPTGTFSTTWDQTSVAAATTGVANQFGGQLQTRSTGAVPLLLPLQLDGNPTREIIKRRMPNDSTVLSESRFHTKGEIRILLDDEGITDASGIPSGQGVNLSTFTPNPLPNNTVALGGGRALWRITDAGAYNEPAIAGINTFPMQQQNGTAVQADTVHGSQVGPPLRAITAATNANPIKISTSGPHGYSTGDKVFISGVGGNTNANGGYTITVTSATQFTLNGRIGNAAYTSGGSVYSFTAIPKSSNGTAIPAGSGISGKILIQLVDSTGTTYDVTQTVLSMGITEGEPNSIVQLQRPLWAAFLQGSRDASGSTNPALNGDPVYTNCLVDILTQTHIGADGEIKTSPAPTQDGTYGYLTGVVDDTASGTQPVRSDAVPGNNLTNLLADWGTGNWDTNRDWNAIVPINVYNVREGLINSAMTTNNVYERGITPVVEVNMRNLARWVDGVYDTNLLTGTNAVSTHIASPDGYTLYVSDRRGDNVRSMVDSSGATISSTNGMVDNEDIYGTVSSGNFTGNATLDGGEDVQNTGVLVRDTAELPDPAPLPTSGNPDYANYGADRNKRAIAVAAWTNPNRYFRGSVRMFNGENLQISGGAGKLSTTKGITVASENMVYLWGNYNTTGINGQPAGGSTLNDSTLATYYQGNQVPASIVCDAFFPLSKTWFDAESSLNPDNLGLRLADRALPAATASNTWETSCRAGIIAGNNLSALAAPSGGADAGNSSAGESRLNGGMHNFPRFLEQWSNRWNFVGSLIPLYHSTQALGPYNANSVIYSPPVRNWAFDSTFLNPNKLPPGTPMFEYIEPTGFKDML